MRQCQQCPSSRARAHVAVTRKGAASRVGENCGTLSKPMLTRRVRGSSRLRGLCRVKRAIAQPFVAEQTVPLKVNPSAEKLAHKKRDAADHGSHEAALPQRQNAGHAQLPTSSIGGAEGLAATSFALVWGLLRPRRSHSDALRGLINHRNSHHIACHRALCVPLADDTALRHRAPQLQGHHTGGHESAQQADPQDDVHDEDGFEGSHEMHDARRQAQHAYEDAQAVATHGACQATAVPALEAAFEAPTEAAQEGGDDDVRHEQPHCRRIGQGLRAADRHMRFAGALLAVGPILPRPRRLAVRPAPPLCGPQGADPTRTMRPADFPHEGVGGAIRDGGEELGGGGVARLDARLGAATGHGVLPTLRRLRELVTPPLVVAVLEILLPFAGASADPMRPPDAHCVEEHVVADDVPLPVPQPLGDKDGGARNTDQRQAT
eukprot:CAMPEP_0176325476 /NCGR_PEP_ID=MMETSP0121_2-20121125/73433_1 /TAXON_ID=160619 /ORGANISM="Kryptoperidinium foliaceum, Strain CCMP 1326" /LENGTH=434 /DNA_ID=CAMNT_0017668049 /DNA_START=66 /DNA_END=1371 /DNA_ORIENTATION=-